jgi:hypothetical protein
MWPNPSRKISRTPTLARKATAADHVAALGVTGSRTKPLLGTLKMFGPIEISSVPSSAVFDPNSLDRVGRYEARLWRQAVQTIWTLDAMRRPQPAPTRRPFRKPVARFFWDAEREGPSRR